MGWRKQSVPHFKGKKHWRQISNVLGISALEVSTNVASCVFLSGNLLPRSSLSNWKQHLIKQWSFLLFYEKKKNIKKWLMGWRKQSVPFFKGKNQLRQISNVLGIPALEVLKNVGCHVWFLVGQPSPIVEPIRKKATFAEFMIHRRSQDFS